MTPSPGKAGAAALAANRGHMNADFANRLERVAEHLESIRCYHGPSNGGSLESMIRQAELARSDLDKAIAAAKHSLKPERELPFKRES